ncbi:MAG: hypothetical protein FWE84_05770, partial [Firmicutes bacterium]|nr:hypothetical protein [Bacillota bacterium]
FRRDEILARQVRSAGPPPRKFPSRQKSARYPTTLSFVGKSIFRLQQMFVPFCLLFVKVSTPAPKNLDFWVRLAALLEYVKYAKNTQIILK